MHLGYLDAMRNADLEPLRRSFLKRATAALLTVGAGAVAATDDLPGRGFKGSGKMNMSTGEDWIDTFYTGGAAEIVHYYADDFVFEDVTLFQTIDNKEARRRDLWVDPDLFSQFLVFKRTI